MRRAGVVLGIGLVGTLAMGCVRATSAAPPVVICGKTLYSGAVGLGVYGPSNPAAPRYVPTVVSGTPILFRLSTDCGRGVRYTVTPAGLVGIERQIEGTHGGVVAVSLEAAQPGRAVLTITSGQDSGWSQPFVTSP
jgi:hypothetical protein